ncbi:dihydroorotase [Helicobacter pametensis]|uniref:dihydroorotase n=1 Tax=Helicobacter pametensis TaxID=95149 RepID=UPI0004812A61|nr:dihydroorotase [Helicobacter pametensis]
MSQSLILKNPLDMHLHLREGEVLESVFPYTYQGFVGGVVMPNLSTPISNAHLALEYYNTLKALCADFTPLITIYLTPKLSIQELHQIKSLGFKILKLYPKGATTNSQDGMSEILAPQTLEVLSEAEKLEMILSIHAESGGYSLDREFEFLPIIAQIAQTFPKLKIIIEHLSDHRSIELLNRYDNVFATLTLHHITLCLDDLLGGGLNPHLFCKPILKSPKDRDALLELALSAHPKVSFGSDSAPHLASKKLSNPASAGIFSAPLLLEQLCELFEKHQALENLQAFVSDNAVRNYGLTFEKVREVKIQKISQKLPQAISLSNDQIIPLNAGKEISWSMI